MKRRTNDAARTRCGAAIAAIWASVALSLAGGGAAIAATPSAAPRVALASAAYPDGALEGCLTLDGADVEGQIGGLARTFFDAEIAAVDLPRLVDRKWLELGMPNLLQREVDRAIEGVRRDTPFTQRTVASFSPASANALAERVAEHTFRGEALQKRLTTLADEVAAEFTRTFTTVAARSAGETAACLQRYLGAAYGDAVGGAFERELQRYVERLGTEALTQGFVPEVGVGATSAVGITAIAGGYAARAVAQRLSTQLTRRIAGNLSARLLGRAGTAAIPVVGWVLGGGLIIWDLASSALHGPFPAIRRQLTSEATQRDIQLQIVAALRDELPEVSEVLAHGVAEEVARQWGHFTESFGTLIVLAEDPDFHAALHATPAEQLYTLARVAERAPEDVVAVAREGRLGRVLRHGENALRVLEVAPLSTVLAWLEVAGDRFDELVAFEVYRYKAPTDFSSRSLARLLDTGDFRTVAALALLPREEMDPLLALPAPTLNALADAFPRDLSAVAFYVGALPQEARNDLVTRLLEQPSRLEKFTPPAVRRAVASSREPRRAVAMVGSEPTFGPFGADLVQGFGEDVTAVLSGHVRPRLLLAKYHFGPTAAAATLPLVAAVLLPFVLLAATPYWWWRRLRRRR
ncbi:hypothetical protein [Truepera radiovictrix]|uniref:Uncharacterized protein n=1 Tax=Truepera radiovictrix (strain DSM 17093 / CIP 108686 / LMG 22925 / RQ-24) TaxID=649638 RepID=D7CS27_TRURR|nr:hypothetical protein [Truepera radiovictrix]ADI15355.1 hypothetical protein Trad_2245 [Truepera radiovictrix DSM 17093]WMT56094.1 hypothetical protein RCV51_08720 [Truepera radiovictrix]